MSITQSLNNALSGLTASAKLAEVTSSNLSNALTDGYGRRRLEQSAQGLGDAGSGVRIDGITRLQDRGILSERRLADAEVASHETTAKGLTQLETLLGRPEDGDGLANRVVALEQSLFSAASEPSSDLRLSGVLDRLALLTDKLNQDQDGIQSIRQSADRDIERQINTLNTSLALVERFNKDIVKAKVSGVDPSGLMDQRQRAVDQVAEIVPVRVLERENGRLALMSISGEMMLDGPAATYAFSPTTTIMPHMTFGVSLLSGITRNGVSLSTDNGFGKLQGGSLEATFALRDVSLVHAQDGLDAVARDLVNRFQDTSVDPSLALGGAGLLTDAGSAFAAVDTTGLAGRIAVNTAVDPNSGGALWRLRDGVGAAALGPIGDATQINRWLHGLSDPRVLHLGGANGKAADHAARLAAEVGNDRVAAEERTSFATARWGALKKAELAGGVDSDQEMQMLLRVEQAYAANARVIQTVQAMMRALMEI